MDKKIIVGSRAFFSQYEDFEPSDNDFVEIHDDTDKDFWVTNDNGEHVFHFKRMEKSEFISFELQRCITLPMIASKFIVNEMIDYLGMTLNELILFIDAFNNIGKKHKYVKYIFDCYLQNGDMNLTDEQRDEAYSIYKNARCA